MPQTFLEWVAWAGLVFPLAALAWSAWQYVDARKREIAHSEYRRIFEVMDHLGAKGGSIASKVAAAYELRRFPEYSDMIVRLCEQVKVEGDSAEMLLKELELTKRYFESRKKS